MPVPNVGIGKADGNTAVVRPSTDGVLAIIAPASAGTANLPAPHTQKKLAYAQFSDGPLARWGAYTMGRTGKPVLLIRPATSTPASYSALAVNGAGSAAITHGASDPANDYASVLVTFTTGGTRGTPGIVYTYTLDGKVVSAPQALGTNTTLTIPNSGVSLNIGVGTILTGQTVAFSTKCARMNNTDLVNALEALRVTKAAWDEVLIHGEADVTMAETVNDWIVELERKGRFGKGAQINARFQNAGETDAAYLASLSTQFGGYANSTGIELGIGADCGMVVDSITGLTFKEPVSLLVAARLMSISIGTDAAYVELGPVDGVSIADESGVLLCHDEATSPGLDDQRFITLTTFDDPDGPQGVYLTNPNLFSANGSDYVYVQHTRVMNRACRFAHALLTRKLSKGVRKDNATGHILEVEAAELEGLVDAKYQAELVGKECSDAALVLSRTDDLSSNAGAKITGDVQVESLAYIKEFALTAKFVKQISAQAA